MNAVEAVDAMSEIFLAAWVAAGYSADNVRWTSVPGETLPEDIWARVTIRHALGDASSLGGDQQTYTNEGVIVVQVFVPVGAGSVPMYTAAQHVVTAFRNARNVFVWFRNARMNEVGNSGVFEQINVLADFTYDDLR